jgi:hypothetical protein
VDLRTTREATNHVAIIIIIIIVHIYIYIFIYIYIYIYMCVCMYITGTLYYSWMRPCVTNRKVTGSLPDEAIDFLKLA